MLNSVKLHFQLTCNLHKTRITRKPTHISHMPQYPNTPPHTNPKHLRQTPHTRPPVQDTQDTYNTHTRTPCTFHTRGTPHWPPSYDIHTCMTHTPSTHANITHTTCSPRTHHVYATDISNTHHTCPTRPQLSPSHSSTTLNTETAHGFQTNHCSYATHTPSTHTPHTPNLRHLYGRQMLPPLRIDYRDTTHTAHRDTTVTHMPHSHITPTPNTRQGTNIPRVTREYHTNTSPSHHIHTKPLTHHTDIFHTLLTTPNTRTTHLHTVHTYSTQTHSIYTPHTCQTYTARNALARHRHHIYNTHTMRSHTSMKYGHHTHHTHHTYTAQTPTVCHTTKPHVHHIQNTHCHRKTMRAHTFYAAHT